MSSVTHLFLTGEKRVGKSTLLQKLLEGETRRLGGFHTLRTDAFNPPKLTVHLLRAGADEAPDSGNLLFTCDAVEKGDTAARFDALGCAALRDCAGVELIFMDELGPRESNALAFQSAVLRAIDGDIPIIGVLQEADSPFLDAIKAHPKVRLVTVTEQNRNSLAETLPREVFPF